MIPVRLQVSMFLVIYNIDRPIHNKVYYYICYGKFITFISPILSITNQMYTYSLSQSCCIFVTRMSIVFSCLYAKKGLHLHFLHALVQQLVYFY
jgi:Golgi nucleoside diphosphatase